MLVKLQWLLKTLLVQSRVSFFNFQFSFVRDYLIEVDFNNQGGGLIANIAENGLKEGLIMSAKGIFENKLSHLGGDAAKESMWRIWFIGLCHTSNLHQCCCRTQP
jgi:hypothetical protein